MEMNIKTYCRISATVFTIVALAHLTRLMYGWSVQIGELTVPAYISVFGFAIPAGLAFLGFRGTR